MDEFFAEMAKHPLRILFVALVLLAALILLFWQQLSGLLGWSTLPLEQKKYKLSEEQIREIHENLREVSSTTPKLTSAEIRAIQEGLEDSAKQNPDAYNYSTRGIDQIQQNLQNVSP